MSEPNMKFHWGRVKAAIFGKPIASSRAHFERLSPLLGLPVFASDALSSVAYGTEAILGVLVLGGALALKDQIFITLGIGFLILIIVLSYNQTIHAYSKGGGSYIVASENLGDRFGLVAGAALLIDYVLTVAVSVAAGVAALDSAFPQLSQHIVAISIVAILLIAYMNLRGIKESGAVFAIPVYGFVVGIFALILIGLFKTHGVPTESQVVLSDQIGKEAGATAIFLILRSYAAGCTALTGIEAVSDGVQAFQPPESENASKTLKAMGVLLILMFLGIGLLAHALPSINLYSSNDPHYRSVVSQIAAYVFGGKSFGFYYVQFSTAIILVLAANTSFADFPRLSSFLSRDGYLPRSLARQGDRLVFHNGIVILALLAAILIYMFKGQLDALLPLYAIGVFTAFTLSQTGMVFHWRREGGRHARHSMIINGIGAFVSGIVLLVILVTKFLEGAWVVVVLMVILYSIFFSIKERYRRVNEELTSNLDLPSFPSNHKVILLVPRVHRGIIQALDYALLIRAEVEAVHVTIDERTLPALNRSWQKFGRGVPLIILSSPYRSLIQPICDYVDELQKDNPNTMFTVIVPEAISTTFWGKFLQENVGLQLKLALSSKKNVVVSNVRYFLH